MRTVQVIGPHLGAAGGVANYFNVMLPYLRAHADLETRYAALGSGGGHRLLHMLDDQRRIYALLGSTAPDIVHINPSLGYKSFIRDALIVLSAKRRGLKVLVFFHGWSADMAGRIDGPLGRVFSASYARADGFVVLAREFEQRLRSWGVTRPIFLSTTAVAEDSIDESAVRRRLRTLADAGTRMPVRILYMSRLEAEKGPMETLESVKQLLDSGYSLKLTLAGGGPASAAIAEYMRQNSSLRQHVSIPGQVDTKTRACLLHTHDLFCLPTRYGEGMPTALLEAMAFGMAVVSSPVGGIPDFFEAGKMGALVPGCNREALTRALAGLVADRTGLARMGQANFDYARRNFYASKVADQLSGIYRSVLGAADGITMPPAAPEPYRAES